MKKPPLQKKTHKAHSVINVFIAVTLRHKPFTISINLGVFVTFFYTKSCFFKAQFIGIYGDLILRHLFNTNSSYIHNFKRIIIRFLYIKLGFRLLYARIRLKVLLVSILFQYLLVGIDFWRFAFFSVLCKDMENIMVNL